LGYQPSGGDADKQKFIGVGVFFHWMECDAHHPFQRNQRKIELDKWSISEYFKMVSIADRSLLWNWIWMWFSWLFGKQNKWNADADANSAPWTFCLILCCCLLLSQINDWHGFNWVQFNSDSSQCYNSEWVMVLWISIIVINFISICFTTEKNWIQNTFIFISPKANLT
jgi:hypothetical protein